MHQLIQLPAHSTDDLLWAVEPEGSVIWELDFCPLSEDPMEIQAALLAADYFSEKFWRTYEAQTAAVAIYRGAFDAMPLELLRRIAERLPDELPIFVLLNRESGRARLAHKLSREKLGSFRVAIEDSFLPVNGWIWRDPFVMLAPGDEKVGLCLPEEQLCSQEILDEAEALCDQLEAQGIKYRVVSETFLTEDWEGLDLLYVWPFLVTPRGSRKLMGFCAAGGVVEKIGAEGFEPPTYWSQTSRASQAALRPDNRQ